MATVRSFSVARTQQSFDPATPTPASGVYSIGVLPINGSPQEVASTGRNLPYDYATAQGGAEGRIPTLVLSGQTQAQISAYAGAAGDTGVPTALALTGAAMGAGTVDWPAGTYVCTTTTIGPAAPAGDPLDLPMAAGLQVRVDVDATGAVALNAAPIVRAGNGYLSDDTSVVSIDGIISPNNSLDVTVA